MKNYQFIFYLNQLSFENKPSKRNQFLHIMSDSEDIHFQNMQINKADL